jgi:rhodanese-related sulfurtransferase
MTKITNIKPSQLLQWQKTNKAVIIDVREPAEYRSEAIVGAINLPLTQGNVNKKYLQKYLPKKVVLHCQSGKRSMLACEKLKSEKASFDVWNLQGGIVAWKDAGYDIVASGKRILPLDRQLQLVIGFMVLLGTVLGEFVASAWFVLPVMAGLGLINAGLTGWCGLARVLARMPWNQR